MEYRKTITLKDGRECVLRSTVDRDARTVLDNFILTHGETDFLTSVPEEISLTVEQETEYLRRKVGSPDEAELIAEVSGEVVGTAGIDRLSRYEKMKHRASFGISILKAFWGLGIGRALTVSCIECARAAGYSQLELEAAADNPRALSLYRSVGFTEYGRNPRGFRSPGGWRELVLMRLELDGGDPEDMELVEPTMEYDSQIQAYRREFLETEGSMDGAGSLRRFDRTQDWLDQTEALKREETTPAGMVPSTQFLYVRRSDRKVVGVIQIRHRFNEYLERFGGHIGYSVCPTERRKGYAAQMLARVLPICADLGLDRVLITCIRGNEGSRRTILKNGGVYESTVYEPKENIYLERYWIDLRSGPADRTGKGGGEK